MYEIIQYANGAEVEALEVNLTVEYRNLTTRSPQALRST